MHTISNFLIALTLPVLVVSLSDCGNKKKDNPVNNNDTMTTGSNDTFVYNFHDASVPPPYHRSYTIRVTSGQVYYAISDYDKVLAKDSLVLSKVAYDSFVKAINDLHIKEKEADKHRGCTGGTSDELILYAASEHEVKGYIIYCGGEMYGNLQGDVAAAAGLFRALIPDLSRKIDATMKDN